jgi:CBS domain-containing protein
MEITGTADAILQAKGHAIHAVPPGTTVFEAIQHLADKNVGALLVMDGPRLLGIFSERDYTRKIALQGRHSRDTLVGEIISTEVISTTPQTTVTECMRLMTEHRVRHLPVLDGGRVIGVLSIGDLVNWIITAQSATISHLESYISGGYPG